MNPGSAYRARREALRQQLYWPEVLPEAEQRRYDRVTAAADARWQAKGETFEGMRTGERA